MSARLSMSPDPFAHPCDYFLYSCTSDKPSNSSMWPQGSARHEERENGEEGVLDKRAALLLYLRGVLGRALPLQSSLCVLPYTAFPLSHPMILTIAIRVRGQFRQRGDAESQKVLPVLPRHQGHRRCWSRALLRTHSESENVTV